MSMATSSTCSSHNAGVERLSSWCREHRDRYTNERGSSDWPVSRSCSGSVNSSCRHIRVMRSWYREQREVSRRS